MDALVISCARVERTWRLRTVAFRGLGLHQKEFIVVTPTRRRHAALGWVRNAQKQRPRSLVDVDVRFNTAGPNPVIGRPRLPVG